ncbi:7631_t:CDS:2 [Paraglomus brasilianum]|uniref:7631_t:CDS:1 n=1 Tax=Paraglomus brasilianum TaxID=144538 RepID=A0A9N9FN10_9GLOM|nr:7631_t:CDS:2 [Paraglomus brasilianum]
MQIGSSKTPHTEAGETPMICYSEKFGKRGTLFVTKFSLKVKLLLIFKEFASNELIQPM